MNAIPVNEGFSISSVIGLFTTFQQWKADQDEREQRSDLRDQIREQEDRRYNDALKVESRRLDLQVEESRAKRDAADDLLAFRRDQLSSQERLGLAAARTARKTGELNLKAAKYKGIADIGSSVIDLF